MIPAELKQIYKTQDQMKTFKDLDARDDLKQLLIDLIVGFEPLKQRVREKIDREFAHIQITKSMVRKLV